MSALAEILRKKKKALEQSSGRRGKTEKVPNGTSKWRILPSWRGGEDPVFWHDFGQHFIKDESGDLKAVYVCVDKTYQRECLICDTVKKAMDATDDEGREIIGESKSRLRVLVNAVQVDGPDPNTPVILELPPTVFEAICDIGLNEEYEDFIDLKNGVDITFTRSGKGMNTEYNVQAGRKSREQDPAIMKNVANLDAYVAQEFEEQQAKALASLRKTAGLLPGAGAAVASLGHDGDDDDLDGLDDDIPFNEGRTIDASAEAVETPDEPAEAVEEAAAETSPASDDDDLDVLLAEFNDL